MTCRLQRLSHSSQLLLAFSPLLPGPVHSGRLCSLCLGLSPTSPGFWDPLLLSCGDPAPALGESPLHTCPWLFLGAALPRQGDFRRVILLFTPQPSWEGEMYHENLKTIGKPRLPLLSLFTTQSSIHSGSIQKVSKLLIFHLTTSFGPYFSPTLKGLHQKCSWE